MHKNPQSPRAGGARRKRTALAAMSVLVLTLAGATAARAWAPNTLISWKMAINNGVWDRYGIAHPSYHHRPWGGDWATDVYGNPGSQIAFRLSEDDPTRTPGRPYGIVESNASSCADPGQVAGTAYKIGIYDGSDEYIGWVLYAHVDTSAVGTKAVGSVLYNGAVLGKTKKWAYSSCYQVTNNSGVHTHVEAYNNDDYSCYFPWASGTTLARTDVMGSIGANATGVGQSCW